MKIYLEQLIVESTRRCQLSCSHCLRGKAESLDLDINIMSRFLKASRVNNISCLTISGGEPSLRPDFICDLIDLFASRKVDVDNFYIATNAVKITKEFMFAVLRLWTYCGDNEMSQLEWSNDDYHVDVDKENVKMLKAFTFSGLRCATTEAKSYREGEGIIAEGNADWWGSRTLTPDSFDLEKYSDTLQIQGGGIYINCEGMVIRGCDFSYESQRDPDNQYCPVDAFTPEFIQTWYSKNQRSY